MNGHSLEAGLRSHSGMRQEMTTVAEGEPAQRPHAAASALRLSDPETPLRSLHAGDGRPRCAAARRRSWCGWRSCCAPTPGASGPAPIVYALGWTQHTTGVQMIRTAGILQLLLGNMGRPGGGIMAMRGHSTIQGSTDLPTLYDVLPGYLPQPCADEQHETLDLLCPARGAAHRILGQLSQVHRQPAQGVVRRRRHAGERLLLLLAAAAWMPTTRSCLTSIGCRRGGVNGYFLFGQNPAGGGPNAGLHRAGLRNLDWLVVLDWFEIESAVFWKNDPGGPPPAEIKTEVFFIPAAAAPEKEGSLTNTQRMLQWHDKALDPLGDSRSDAWFLYNLGKRLKQLYAGSTDPRDQPLLHLTWDYEFDQPPRLPDGRLSRIEGEPDLEKVLMEINGYRLDETDPRTGRPRLLSGFSELQDDGTTSCGCWIYSGVFPEPGRNRARERRRTSNPIRSRVGLRLAAQPPHPLQPCVGGPRGTPVVGAKEVGLVGPAIAPVGRPRRAGFRPRGASRLPAAAGRHGNGGDRGQPAVHHEARRSRMALRAGHDQGRAAAHPLRARRVADGQLALSQAGMQPGGAILRGAAQPAGPHSHRGIPGGRDHLSPHRALPERTR